MPEAPGLEAQALDLVSQFLADIAGRREPWPGLFNGWADQHELKSELRSQTRVAIVRARVFGAVQRHGNDTA